MSNFFENLIDPSKTGSNMLGNLLMGPAGMAGLGALLNKRNRMQGAMQGLVASSLVSPLFRNRQPQQPVTPPYPKSNIQTLPMKPPYPMGDY